MEEKNSKSSISKRSKIVFGLIALVVLAAAGLGVWGIKTGKIQTSAFAYNSVKGRVISNTQCYNRPTVTLWKKPDGSSSFTKDMSGRTMTTGFWEFVNRAVNTSYYATVNRDNKCAATTNWAGNTALSVGKCGGLGQTGVGHMGSDGASVTLEPSIQNVPFGGLVKVHAWQPGESGGVGVPVAGVKVRCDPSSEQIGSAKATTSQGEGYVYCGTGATKIIAIAPAASYFKEGTSRDVTVDPCQMTIVHFSMK